MISRDMIKHISGERTFSRGASVYKMNRIKKFDLEKCGDIDRINAVVRGSASNNYNVNISIENEFDGLADAYCECPAFESYSGICKHCVAVLLEYRDTVSQQMSLNRYLESQRRSNMNARMIQKGIKLETTHKFKELLYSMARKNTMPMLDVNTYGKINIEPHMIVNAEGASVSFKVGANKLYLVKDIFEFAQNVKEGKRYAYGKNLEFFHCIESFSEESKPIVQFIIQWVEGNRDRYKQPIYGRYYSEYSLPKLRHMQLSAEALQGFINIMEETSFYVAAFSDDEQLYKVSHKVWDKSLLVEGSDNGVDVSIPPIRGAFTDKYIMEFSDGQIALYDRKDINEIEDFVKCLSSIKDSKVHISKDDVPIFCRDLLPLLKEKFTCDIQDFEEIDYDIIKPEISVYIDMPQEGMITCTGKADYGNNEYLIYDNNTDVIKRDMIYEAKIARNIAKYCNSFDEENKCMVLSDQLDDFEENLYEFIKEGIPALQEISDVYVTDALKKINIISSPSASIGVSLAGDLLKFNITTENISLDQLAEILSKYNRKKKYYRLKNGDFISAGDGRLEDIVEVTKGLNLTKSQLLEGNAVIPKYRALYIDNQIKDSISVKSIKDKNFKALIRNMKTIEDNDYEVPSELNSVLRPYQKYGFMWIKTLCHNGFGGILADDMGLGKTVQIISFLKSEYDENETEAKRTLIVCPASLVYNWKAEFEKFAPDLPVTLVIGNQEERKELVSENKDRMIYVTSYDLLRRDIELYEEMEFFCQVIDEAQYIKNHNTKASRAVKSINTAFKIALTGTPVENRLSELHSIFEYIMPGFLYTYKRFREELEVPIVTNDDEEAKERLKKMISPFVLRRLKKDVLKDLPDKIEENMYFKMQGEQAELYDAHIQRIKIMLENKSDEEFKNSKIQILSELTKLRQLCCNPSLIYEDYKGCSGKLDMCIDMVERAVNEGHKVLLFSQFTTMFDSINNALEERGISHYCLTGKTSKEKRIELVDEFNSNDVSVFCISLKAGGTGLNLTAADVVIHYDPWWNVAVQNQATDRAHRIGQENVVNVYRLIAKDSIEENIVKLQEKKSQLADSILGAEAMNGTSLSKDEILELLN